LRPIEALAKVKAPVLVVGGGADRFTPPDESRVLLAASGGAKELLLLDGMDHAQATWVDTPDYRERLKAFLTAALGAGKS
jgi:pimeloyl-ACP methyl ester carboxylesterase